MTRQTLLALPLILAACMGGDRSGGTFREAGAPIWSAAAFDAAMITGDWQQVAGFAEAPGGCHSGAIRFAPVGGGLKLSGSLCLNGKLEKLRGTASASGPGRLIVGGEEWWILWVDSGYRTMAIGTPSGRFGIVLDRGAIPADRLNAAREIFDFNGYRTEALTTL